MTFEQAVLLWLAACGHQAELRICRELRAERAEPWDRRYGHAAEIGIDADAICRHVRPERWPSLARVIVRSVRAEGGVS